jgi:aldehyde:ferredoxin oxidoreductase
MTMYMMFARMRPEEPIETSLDATRLSNEFGICTMELQSMLFWLEACHREGLMKTEQTGLDFSSLGSLEFIKKLVSMIARREGFGDVLAEGIIRAGKKLGPEAEALFSEYTNAVGLESTYGPREYPVTALLYGLEPRQPIAQLHDISHLIARWLLHLIRPKLSPTTAAVFRKAVTKFWKHEKAWDMTILEGKAEAAIHIQNRTYAKDSLGLCDFGWPIMYSFNTEDHTGDPTLENQLFSAVTGIDVDEPGLELYGERIFNVQRAILLREGWRAKEDDTPAEFHFTVPLTFDPLNPRLIVPGEAEEPACMKGEVLDREGFEHMRQEFYELRSWDLETGLLKSEALEELKLGDVAEALKQDGLI